MPSWKSITKDELLILIKNQLRECTVDQVAFFDKYAVELNTHKIDRLGQTELVYIAAIKDNEALYYEDVEEGWNFSPYQPVLESAIEQYELKHALNIWMNN